MDLKDYVKEVISQISEAVSEINNSADEQRELTLKSPIVNPTFVELKEIKGQVLCVLESTKSSMGTNSPKAFCKITDVDFDVTLSASSKSEKGGKIDIRVLGGGTAKGDEASATNHVKFTLPVLFPSIKQPHN